MMGQRHHHQIIALEVVPFKGGRSATILPGRGVQRCGIDDLHVRGCLIPFTLGFLDGASLPGYGLQAPTDPRSAIRSSNVFTRNTPSSAAKDFLVPARPPRGSRGGRVVSTVELRRDEPLPQLGGKRRGMASHPTPCERDGPRCRFQQGRFFGDGCSESASCPCHRL